MSGLSKKVMLVSGESSGDQHGANLFLELKKRSADIQGIGMGGKKMAEAGIDIQYDSSNIGVIGVIEVIKRYAEIKRALNAMQSLLLEQRPDLLICVDYKEFNFKLAGFAKKNGIKVLFYVSPQIWAWRPGRVVKYGKVIDMMAVIFPFEVPFYEKENVPVRYVGHPSVETAHAKRSRDEDFKEYGLAMNQPVVGILPGSRTDEINRMLPVMLRAAERIQKEIPGVQFVLPQADSVSDELLQASFQQSSIEVTNIKNQFHDVVQCCDAVMTVSGTATLEIALLNVPMLVAYKLSTITYLLAKILVDTEFIGLPNIIAGKSVVKEFIQYQATPENLAQEIIHLLTNKQYAATVRDGLQTVKIEVGKGGGSENMAELALEMLQD
ncbi:MAG: lipid-A-disaccharide synthase [Gammaproteobacteria bacterium]|jgi:lipid-A-disaccharide synthase|nr:lipid-A-disaccharide synthase [Gammaproteobacteria bacterium]MBT5223689.1 lipid-A-disaccharide synthase [Gammaproteobacteria bacterium]MBT5824605.1 lipid-A-disaccharide synthase [Gammaproteobacteria bacterium]MBT6420816.1 lipid-A-disaccharide synthase [Gammaproteobacteria bacterium]MBT6576438.1 lipid-A-disaccharide synthase [Gammaproteobacteria bacterium]